MNDCEHDFLVQFSSELEKELIHGILPYWIENTVDETNGGFYGRITFDNIPVKDAEKGAILIARILWAFSAAYKKFNQPKYKEIADRAYTYLTETLWDEKHGGVYWMVDANGTPTEYRKHVYAEAFSIYALSEYYGAFGDHKVLDISKDLFRLIEEKCKDTNNGGYFEAYSRDWKLLDDVRLSDKDRNEPKSMNTHLHLLEGYTNLYRYWKTDELKNSLSKLIDIFEQHIINKEQNSLITFLGEEWSPRSDEISFGHNIETTWLLLEAVEVLGDGRNREPLVKTCLHIVNHVMETGMDANGGIFNQATPTGIEDDNKDWWPQAEAIVGFMNAYQLTHDFRYMTAASKVWEFVKKYMIDTTHGEWHEKVNRLGTPYHLDKVRSWKCPYHNGRMALEVILRAEFLLGPSPKRPTDKEDIAPSHLHEPISNQ